jgi:hypothetical protein
LPPPGWVEADPDATPIGHPGWLYLLLMTALACVLRFWRLDGPSLWVDELMTWRMSAPGQQLAFWQQVRDAIHGPVYVAAVWPLLRYADTEFLLRLPAAIAGVATVPLFGSVAGRLVPRTDARLATLLLALSPFHVWYSQEARGYAFAVFFTVVLVALYLAAREHGLTPAKGAGLAVIAALGIGSNTSVLIFWAVLVLTAALGVGWRPPALAAWAGVFLLGCLLASPWLGRALGIWEVGRVVPGAGLGEALRGTTTFSPLALPFTGFAFFFGFSLGPSLAELHRPDRVEIVASYWPLLALCGLVVGVPLLNGLIHWRRRHALVLFWIVLPLAAIVLLAVRNVKPYNVRYACIVLPWILLVAARGLATLPRRLGMVWTAALVVLTLTSLGGYYFADRYQKEDIRAAAAYIAASSAPDDAVLVPVVTAVFRYYHAGDGPVLATWGVDRLDNLEEARALVASRLAGRTAVWIVLAREWFLDPRGWLPEALAEAGRLRAAAAFPGVRVLRWERRPSPRGADALPRGGVERDPAPVRTPGEGPK